MSAWFDPDVSIRSLQIPPVFRKMSAVQDLEHPVWNEDLGLFQESDAQFRVRVVARYQSGKKPDSTP